MHLKTSALRTTDGGITWHQRALPGPPENISAPTMDDAWLFVHRSGVDSHGTLFATSDGGSTWRRVVLPPMRRTGPGDRPTAT